MVPGGFNPHWSVGIVPFASDGLEAVQSKVFVDDWALMVGNQGDSSHGGEITKASPRCYQASRMSVHASHRFNLINNEPDNENNDTIVRAPPCPEVFAPRPFLIHQPRISAGSV